jgi:hypothetical protein
MSAQPRWEPSARTAQRAGRSTPLETVAASPDVSTFATRMLVAIAFASLAAAAIHVAAAFVEAGAGTATILFFAGVAAAQALWGLVALVRGTRAWLVLGALGNLAVAGVWLWSRTAGLPVGPEAGVTLPVSFPDLTSTVLEIGIAVGAMALALRGRRVDGAARRAPGFTAVAGLLFAALAVVAVLAQAGAIASVSAGT